MEIYLNSLNTVDFSMISRYAEFFRYTICTNTEMSCLDDSIFIDIK